MRRIGFLLDFLAAMLGQAAGLYQRAEGRKLDR
jgi:hypothetical protein